MSTAYTTEREAGKEHHLVYTKGFVAARIIQFILSIICLGLSAYIVSYAPFTGAALELFTALIGVIAGIYILVAHFGPAKAFNYWAILGLDIFFVIFWLVSWALLAAAAASVFSYRDYYDDYGYGDAFTVAGGIIAAAAALGAINWVTHLATLVIHSMALHRHRKAGLRAMPGASARSAEAGTAGGEKVEMQPQQPQQAYQQPQQTYAQQPQQTYPTEHQHQQQYYQQSQTPMTSQPTGNSYADPNAYPQQSGYPVHEAPAQQH